MRRVRIVGVLIAITACTAIGACKKEGPAERAGKKIDDAAEKAANAVEDAGDKAKDAVDR
jgi:hypothetical protein